jgi:hypothetical protein
MSKEEALEKLLRLGALNKGEMFAICGWPMEEVDGVLKSLIRAKRVTTWNLNFTRMYRVV